jgi:3-dehydroquinate dehydratase-2
MSRLVMVLNGPNLNLLGQRQPEIYGRETMADVQAACRVLGVELGLDIRFHQSNREYELIYWIHEAREVAAAIVINPGAFTHTSIAILDALNAFDGAVIEVHISNVHKREAFRHHSYVSARADGIIVGCGTEGYLLALRRAATLIAEAYSASATRSHDTSAGTTAGEPEATGDLAGED